MHIADGKRTQNHADCETLQLKDHEYWDLVGKATASTYAEK